MTDYFLGIDLGGTNVKMGIFDDRGQVIVLQSIPCQVELGPDSLVGRISATASTVVEPCAPPAYPTKN